MTRDDFTDQLLRMIVALGLPMRSVHNTEMQRVFSCLDRTVTLPSASTIKNQLMVRLHEILPKLLKNLPDDGTRVSLALDCWTSRNRQAYMAVTAYFIDTKWRYHEVLLAFEHTPGRHTGANLAGFLAKIIERNQLEGRVLAITTDNASNNESMYSDLHNTFDPERQSIVSNLATDEHIPCLAHVFQLALGALLGEIHIAPSNEILQQGWEERVEREQIDRIRGALLTFAKVILVIIMVIYN